jgi:hypothetical protein
MRNPQGYNLVTMPGEKPVEHDTVTCPHCQWVGLTKGANGHLQVKVFSNDGATFRYIDAGFCRKCMRHTCPRKECQAECFPIEARIEAEELLARKFICS